MVMFVRVELKKNTLYTRKYRELYLRLRASHEFDKVQKRFPLTKENDGYFNEYRDISQIASWNGHLRQNIPAIVW